MGSSCRLTLARAAEECREDDAGRPRAPALPQRASSRNRLGPEPLGADLREVELRRPGPRDHDEVDAARNEVRVGPEALATQTLHPVSLHGAAHAPTHDEPEPGGPWRALGRDEQREMSRSDPAGVAITLGARELRVFAEPAVGAKGHRHVRSSGTRAARAGQRLLLGAYFL